MKSRWLAILMGAVLVASMVMVAAPQTALASTCSWYLGTFEATQWRTRASGNWNSNAVWQCYGPTFNTWYNATTGQYPSSTSDSDNVEIRSGHAVALTASETIASLTLTSGKVTMGSNNLTVTGAIGGSFSGSNMVVADGAGSLCKSFGTISNYTYPIGDASGDYSPVTGVTVTGSASGSPSICFRVTDAVYPSKPAVATTWITRYWTGTKTGTWTTLNYGATFTFVAADPNGGSDPMDGKKWDGATWMTLNPVSGTSFSGSNLTSLSDFTAYNSAPTAVTLASFTAAQASDAIVVAWETTTELDNRGFNLWRGTSEAGPDLKLNETLIPSQSQGLPGSGFTYAWEDRADLVPGATYWYWLEDLDVNGVLTRHDPISVDYVTPTAIGLAGFGGTAGYDYGLIVWAVLGALVAVVAAAGRRRKDEG